MSRLIIIFLGFILIYAPTSRAAAPVAQFPQCGYDFNCYYQELAIQHQQEKQQEQDQVRASQQMSYVMEDARLGEMQRQTELMEAQNERSTYQDDKIEAQEEEIQSQQAEIEDLNQTIDKLNSQIKNDIRTGNSNQRTDSSSSSVESQSPEF